jgi:membrane-associated protein
VAIAIVVIVWHVIQSRREVAKEIREGTAAGPVETLDLSTGTGHYGIDR